MFPDLEPKKAKKSQKISKNAKMQYGALIAENDILLSVTRVSNGNYLTSDISQVKN